MRNITIGIMRPQHGMQLITTEIEALQQYPVLKFFPDNKHQNESDFPAEGVSIISKPQGHLIVAYKHHEKLVFSDFTHAVVDLDAFSEHWKGCRIVVFDNMDIN